MKILKDKEYEELLSFKESHADLMIGYKSVYDELRDLKWEFRDLKKAASLNFNISRIVVGKKASGKTRFVKSKIIPQLKNYFLIDMCNEYTTVLPENKYVFNSKINLEKSKTAIMDAIDANRNKTIIFEDPFSAWYSDRWLVNLATEGLNFILITNSTKRIERLLNFAEYVCDLGGIDWGNISADIKNKIIPIHYVEEDVYA